MKITETTARTKRLLSLKVDSYEPARNIIFTWGDKILDIKDVVINYETDHKYDLRGDHLDALRFGYQTIELSLSTKPNLSFLMGSTTL